MTNDIETLFSGSRIQTLNNGQKNIYIQLSDYFSVHYRNWVLEKDNKVTGIIFGLLYRNFKIVRKEEYYHYLGDNDVRTLIRYTLDSIFCLINVANDQSEYKIHISDNEFVIIINRCLKDLKMKNPTVFMKTLPMNCIQSLPI